MTLHRRTFLKQLGGGAAGLTFIPTFRLGAETVGEKLPRSAPEEQGVSSAGILGFLDAAAKSKHELHSFILARHGQVVASGWWAPYRPEANHMLYSLSKSFTSTAVGLAVTEGKLHVDDLVTSFFPGQLPAKVDDRLAGLRVKHLLTMSVGHAKDSTNVINKEHDWAKAFLAYPIDHDPGSVFLYNSGCTYMLSAIVQKVTGQKVIDFLRPRLFDPLEVHGMTWETCPLGINTGGWGLSVQTETLAKFAQLYLQKGHWNDRQLVPASWVETATTFKIQQPPTGGKTLEQLKVTSDWHQGYCYQFWRCRHNAFRGDGAFGQYAIVMPEQDAVVAITCETADMQTEINLVWDHLLPSIKTSPLPPDRSAQAELRRALDSLSLAIASGENDSPLSRTISGQTFHLDQNETGFQSVAFKFNRGSCEVTLKDAAGKYPVRSGLGQWMDGACNIPNTPPKLTVADIRPVKVAASAAWQDANTLTMLWRYYETPHHDRVTVRFDGDKMTWTWLNSMAEIQPGAHTETRPVLTGRIG